MSVKSVRINKAYKNLAPDTLLEGNQGAGRAVKDWASRRRFSQQELKLALEASKTIGQAKAFLSGLRRVV
jgi:DNA-binding transcriptional regulator YhcF (GntR family)